MYVLVVEDDPDLREAVTEALRAVGHQVYAAATAADALRHSRGAPPAVVVMDLILPDACGFSLYEGLRALPTGAALPIVIVSGFDERLDEAAAVGLAPFALLRKPVTTGTLVSVVARAYATSQQV